MRTELKEFVCDSLSARKFVERGLYRRDAVAGVLDQHFSGRADASNKIFALLMLELWHQKFIDERRNHLVA
jgi:asparagine synthase (glutamine-hydrolysing)